MVSAAVKSGRFGSAVRRVGMPKMVVATTSIMEAQYVLPEPKMPRRQRVVKPPRRPHRVQRRCEVTQTAGNFQ